MNKSRFAGLAISLATTAILVTGCPQAAPPNATATPAKPVAATTPAPVASATPVASASASASPAVSGEATEYKSEEAGISVTIPAGWRQQENNGVVIAGPADDTVAVMMNVPDDATMENIGDHVDKLLSGIITDPKPSGEGKEEELNGMKVFSVQGTGTAEGKPCEWMVDFVANKKILMVVYVGESAGIEKNQATLAEMIASIKPIGEATAAEATSTPEADDAASAVASETPAEQ